MLNLPICRFEPQMAKRHTILIWGCGRLLVFLRRLCKRCEVQQVGGRMINR
jgi:hypothetical protein